jgi:excinuclease ABC subunit A
MISEIYFQRKLSQIRGYLPKHFHLTLMVVVVKLVKEGSINVEMVFMADVQLPCETCHGKRFKRSS